MGAGPQGRVLIVAGSDPSGGAGIQADIKTVTALGGYAAAAITALTVQNTQGVTDVMPVAPSFVADQMTAVLDDVGADVIKSGMLHSAACIEIIADVIMNKAEVLPFVLDPVMVSTSGHALLEADAVTALKNHLIPRAAVITPNMAEASVLTRLEVSSLAQMEHAGRMILDMGAKAVVMKGGHMQGDKLTDLLVTLDNEPLALSHSKIATKHTHGTGCTFASALAAKLAQGTPLERAFVAAHAFVQRAIELAPGFGKGNGPLGHAVAGKS